MKKVLLLMGRYLPGYKDGGPLRTMVNVTDALGEEYEFYIAAYDRDHGDTKPYEGIVYDRWNQVGKAKVWYVQPGGFTKSLILQLAEGMDTIYLTSFYGAYGYNTLLLKRLGKLKQPVALASMGVFSQAALAKKALKKTVFIGLCKLLGLFKNVTWSVTSELEAQDVKKSVGKKIRYVVAEDIPRPNVPGIKDNTTGPLRVIFLSRICEHKNLELAIDALIATGNPDMAFTICGPVQEEQYWESCKKKLEKLPCPWTYAGNTQAEDVQETFAHQDVLILPTKSENYGHVIFEALSVGCIPVISDRTPWDVVAQKQAGFVLPLQTEAFADAITAVAQMPYEKRNEMRERGVAIAAEKVEQTRRTTGYRKLFG